MLQVGIAGLGSMDIYVIEWIYFQNSSPACVHFFSKEYILYLDL